MAERLSRLPAWLLAAVLGAAFLAMDPRSADLAAQEYRAALGLVLWDDGWYGGHHVPAYSLVFPVLGKALGPALAGVVAVVAAAAAFERLARDRFGAHARVGALWFALGTSTLLLTGRLTFALGIAIAVAAVLAAQRGHVALAVGTGALASAASPVAGAFLALAAVAWWLSERGWGPVALAAAAIGPAVALALAFPEGGTFPFAAASFWPSLAIVVAAALALPREERVLRVGTALYAAAMVASFLLATPMGGNVVRLGALCAGPVLACALWRRRPLLLAALAVPLLWWQWSSAVGDLARASGDPSVNASYFAPLLHELRARGADAGPARVEIPFTSNHWEARWVAPFVPLARGWERQLDISRNALFYGTPVTSARYRRWLDDNAVAWVALSDARLDYSAKVEAALVRQGLPYLDEVWRGRHWRLFAVRHPAPVATGPATAIRVGREDVALRAHAPGVVDLRVFYSPYWRLERGEGCVERGPGGRVRLRLHRAGIVRLRMAFALGRIGARSPRCTPAGRAGLVMRVSRTR